MNETGVLALLSISSHLFFVGISFYALQALSIEKIMKANRVFQIRLMYILLSITIGYNVSSFFLSYLQATQGLVFLF